MSEANATNPAVRRRAQELLNLVNAEHGLTASEAVTLDTPGLDWRSEIRFVATAGDLAQRQLLKSEVIAELADEIEEPQKESDMPKKDSGPKGWPKATSNRTTAAKVKATPTARSGPVTVDDFVRASSAYDNRKGPASVREHLTALRDQAQRQFEAHVASGGGVLRMPNPGPTPKKGR